MVTLEQIEQAKKIEAIKKEMSLAVEIEVKDKLEKQLRKEIREQMEKENALKLVDIAPTLRGNFSITKKSAKRKKFNDRMLAGNVRSLTLKRIFNLLSLEPNQIESPDLKDLYSKVLVKLAGSVLPRLQEITGEDGNQLTISISKEIADKNNIVESIEEEEGEEMNEEEKIIDDEGIEENV